MTEKEYSEVYLKNLNLIESFARKVGKKYIVFFDTYEDMIQTLKLWGWEAIKKWDKDKAKYSTFLYIVLKSRLKNFAKKNFTRISKCVECESDKEYEDFLNKVDDVKDDVVSCIAIEKVLNKTSSYIKDKMRGYTIEEIANKNKISWMKVQRKMAIDKQEILKELKN